MVIGFIINGIITVVPIIVSCLLCFYQFLKTKERFILLLTLAWFFWTLFIVISLLSIFLASVPLVQLAGVLMVPLTFSLILFVDSISRESVDPTKLVIITAASMAYLIIHLTPGSVFYLKLPNGMLYFYANEADSLAYAILMFLIEYAWVFYLAKIFWYAPKNLKIYASIVFFSQLLSCFIFFISSILIPEITFLIVGLGTLPIAFLFAKHPQLAFILPFKALRLTIFETRSGIALFTHSWSEREDLISEVLFSGMLSGISMILNESVKRGNVREIHLDQAVLIMRKSEEFTVACVLVTTKTSRSLRQALDTFADQFFKKFSPFFSDPSNLDNFKTASDLIMDYFAFIPEYD
ncbi:MAG: hypothetical protein HWN67_07715 [Candidatus Helarchaeota archaeon]|nr:hypothetical protein [Candidatus Helarchaeota archaeon]